jgi:hypothetical protein
VWGRAGKPRAVAQGLWWLRIEPSVMPRERSVDIDDAFDFEFAQWLYERRRAGR